MKKTGTTLLIMAAGIGSRYGSLKQVDPIGPAGETIIDYSIFDAIRSGCEKIVFIIKKENQEVIKNTFFPRWEGKVDIDLVFQELDDIPSDMEINKNRKKPWGTGHAVWSARNQIENPFVVINADDFYGRDSFKKVFDFFTKTEDEKIYCLIGYRIGKTLSKHGFVTRATCKADEDSFLTDIVERDKIKAENKQIIHIDTAGKKENINANTLVSMNMWGLRPGIFEELRTRMIDFLKEEGNNPKAEFLLPKVINHMLEQDKIKVKVIPTDEQWFGMTYREDRDLVVENIRNLVEKKEYPVPVWGKQNKT